MRGDAVGFVRQISIRYDPIAITNGRAPGIAARPHLESLKRMFRGAKTASLGIPAVRLDPVLANSPVRVRNNLPDQAVHVAGQSGDRLHIEQVRVVFDCSQETMRTLSESEGEVELSSRA